MREQLEAMSSKSFLDLRRRRGGWCMVMEARTVDVASLPRPRFQSNGNDFFIRMG